MSHPGPYQVSNSPFLSWQAFGQVREVSTGWWPPGHSMGSMAASSAVMAPLVVAATPAPVVASIAAFVGVCALVPVTCVIAGFVVVSVLDAVVGVIAAFAVIAAVVASVVVFVTVLVVEEEVILHLSISSPE